MRFAQNIHEDNYLNNLDGRDGLAAKNFVDKVMNVRQPDITSEDSPTRNSETTISDSNPTGIDQGKGTEDHSNLKHIGILTITLIVVVVAVAVMSVTNSYPYIITPSKMKSIAEDIEAMYEEKRLENFAYHLSNSHRHPSYTVNLHIPDHGGRASNK